MTKHYCCQNKKDVSSKYCMAVVMCVTIEVIFIYEYVKLMIIQIIKCLFINYTFFLATFILISKDIMDALKVNIETWEHWLHLEDKIIVLIVLSF